MRELIIEAIAKGLGLEPADRIAPDRADVTFFVEIDLGTVADHVIAALTEHIPTPGGELIARLSAIADRMEGAMSLSQRARAALKFPVLGPCPHCNAGPNDQHAPRCAIFAWDAEVVPAEFVDDFEPGHAVSFVVGPGESLHPTLGTIVKGMGLKLGLIKAVRDNPDGSTTIDVQPFVGRRKDLERFINAMAELGPGARFTNKGFIAIPAQPAPIHEISAWAHPLDPDAKVEFIKPRDFGIDWADGAGVEPAIECTPAERMVLRRVADVPRKGHLRTFGWRYEWPGSASAIDLADLQSRGLIACEDAGGFKAWTITPLGERAIEQEPL